MAGYRVPRSYQIQIYYRRGPAAGTAAADSGPRNCGRRTFRLPNSTRLLGLHVPDMQRYYFKRVYMYSKYAYYSTCTTAVNSARSQAAVLQYLLVGTPYSIGKVQVRRQTVVPELLQLPISQSCTLIQYTHNQYPPSTYRVPNFHLPSTGHLVFGYYICLFTANCDVHVVYSAPRGNCGCTIQHCGHKSKYNNHSIP